MIPAVFVVSGFFLAVASLAVRAYLRKPQTGDWGILGETGPVQQLITPQAPGKVFVHGEIWNAYAEEVIEEGEKVCIVATEGLKVKVKKV